MTFQELRDAQLSRSKFKITPQGWKLLSLLLVKPMMSYELAGIVLWPNAKIRDINHIHVFIY